MKTERKMLSGLQSLLTRVYKPDDLPEIEMSSQHQAPWKKHPAPNG
jgi:hypothetical protein